MKGKVIAIVATLGLISVIAGIGTVLAQSLSGGNAVVDRPLNDTWDNFYVMDTNNQIDSNGQVTGFEVYADITVEPPGVTLVIYRQTGTDPITGFR